MVCRNIVAEDLENSKEARRYSAGHKGLFCSPVVVELKSVFPKFGCLEIVSDVGIMMMSVFRKTLAHWLLMGVHTVVTLLESSEASATVVLGAAATLLIAEVLASVGCEKTFVKAPHVSRLSKGNIIP